VVAAATALVATSTPKPRLGFALGLMQVAMFLGSSVGPLVGGLIADNLSYRASFYAAGALMVVGGTVALLFVHERFAPPPTTEPREGVIAGSRALLAMQVFPILIGVIFLIQLGGVIVSPVLSLFIADLSGAENAATVAGTVLAATGAVSAASAIAIGRVSDRIGHTVILPICLLGAAAAYVPQAFVQNVGQLLLLRMLLGVFLGGLMPSANALVAAAVPAERRGAAYGLTATANAFANGVGPLSGAGIATHWGMRAVFLATGALFAVATGWVGIGLRGRKLPRSGPKPA
jgi:DHA1 family multidrug resistance protein-like MFS transporter